MKVKPKRAFDATFLHYPRLFPEPADSSNGKADGTVSKPVIVF
jgi:hypothetical protein